MTQRRANEISDFDLYPALDLVQPVPGTAPGKRTLTQGMAPRPFVMRRRERDDVADDAEAAVGRAGGASGEPLRGDLRDRFEASLGTDLSAVRIHRSAASAEASHAVGARAYAVGNDIHFAAGQYQPDDPFGLHLIAHEVAHTQQQSGGAARRQHKLEVSQPGDAAEVEADHAADAMVAGRPAAISGAATRIARDPSGPSYSQHGGAADDKRAAVGKAPSPGEFAAETESKKGAAFMTLMKAAAGLWQAAAAARKKKESLGLFEFKKKATYDNLIKEINSTALQITKLSNAIATISGSSWAGKLESAGKGFDKLGQIIDVFQTVQQIGDMETLNKFIEDPSEESAEAWADHVCGIFDTASNLVGALPIDVGFIKEYFTGVLKAPSAYVGAFKSIMKRRYAGIDAEAGLSRGKEKLESGGKTVWEGHNSYMITQADLQTDGLHDYILAHKEIDGHDLGKCTGALAKDLLIAKIARDSDVSEAHKAEWMDWLKKFPG